MASDNQTEPISNGVRWAGYIISAIPVGMLLFSATMKLLKPPGVVQGMADHGYPAHLLLPLGIIEAACAIIYAIPRTAVLGAILVTGYLGGAVATHVRVGEITWIAAVILGMFAWLGLLLRDRRLRPLLPFRS